MKTYSNILLTCSVTMLACAVVYLHKKEIDRMIKNVCCKTERACSELKNQVDGSCHKMPNDVEHSVEC